MAKVLCICYLVERTCPLELTMDITMLIILVNLIFSINYTWGTLDICFHKNCLRIIIIKRILRITTLNHQNHNNCNHHLLIGSCFNTLRICIALLNICVICFVHTYINIHVLIHTICAYTRMHAQIHTYIHMYVRTHVHTQHINTHTRILFLVLHLPTWFRM